MSSNEATTIIESAPTKRKVSKKASKETSPVKQSKASKKSTKPKAGSTKKTQKAAATTKAESKERAGTKKAIVLEMLRRKEGATTVEIAKAAVWQNHTILGFISGTVTKRVGLAVESTKNTAGERTYHITA